MNLDTLQNLLSECPIVASVQASPQSPVDTPETLLKLAEASLSQGVRVLRLQGTANISLIRKTTQVPVIGLIKQSYKDSEVYITPTEKEVKALLKLNCEIIALDGTARTRPKGEKLRDLIKMIRSGGALAMADCDSLESALFAVKAGADIISTTLAGYTNESEWTEGPDLETLRSIVEAVDLPVLAEGRFQVQHQARAAMNIGASGIVIGGVLNDPIKQTRLFVKATSIPSGTIGAFDIGGTWIRFGHFDTQWNLLHYERAALPDTQQARAEWMRARIEEHKASHVGIGTGGTIDPKTCRIVETKDLIPDNEQTDFSQIFGQCSVSVLNDGLATAWGHSCHSRYAGKRIASLALGSGIGFGLVDKARILTGPQGAYPRINDRRAPGGATYEELLGGAYLTKDPSEDQMSAAKEAAIDLLITITELYYPETIVVCGGVGLSKWLDIESLEWGGAQNTKVERSPFGKDAGLYGAAALCISQPEIL